MIFSLPSCLFLLRRFVFFPFTSLLLLLNKRDFLVSGFCFLFCFFPGLFVLELFWRSGPCGFRGGFSGADKEKRVRCFVCLLHEWFDVVAFLGFSFGLCSFLSFLRTGVA